MVQDVGETPRLGDDAGARRRRLVAALLGIAAIAVVAVATFAVVREGLTKPVVAGVLGTALALANLVPLITVQGGRVSAFTPVSALLVPIGLLLPLGEAVVVYALGETVGVLASHRLEGSVAAPQDQPAVRTTITLGKSVLGAAVALVLMREVATVDSSLWRQVAAAAVVVGVASLLDHVVLAVVAVAVRGARLMAELSRDLGELLWISAGEIVVGAVIAVLAARDPWSLVLGLSVFALLVAASAAYARASAEHRGAAELLRLAEEFQHTDRVQDVCSSLEAAVRRLLPEDDVRVVGTPPGPDVRRWILRAPGHPDRWLVIPRIVDTRDYDEQSLEPVEAAMGMARVALERASTQERMVEQEKIRSLVLSTVAHDLRAPLTTVSGGLDTLARGLDRLDGATRDELLEAARRGVARMQRLVEDLLGLELAEGQTLETGPIDARPVLARLVEEVREADGVAGQVEITFEGPSAMVSVGAVSLERIVENLLVNACKYARRQVTVRAEPRDEGLEIVVADDGPGIAPEVRPVVFDAFEQAGAGRGGVGLGLYVARRFVDLHGGRIWVGDAPGGGAAFTVWLPAPT